MDQLKTKGIESFTSTIKEPVVFDEDGEELLTGSEAKIAAALRENPDNDVRSKVSIEVPIPTAPFWGNKVVENISLEEIFEYINESALIKGQWQVRKGKRSEEEYRKEVDEKVRPDLERLKEQAIEEQLLQPKVVYGYFPCQSAGNDLIIYKEDLKTERMRFTFPRQQDDRFLCLSDYFAPKVSGKIDVVPFHMVTMGKKASEHSAKLFAADNYKEYLYFHGLSVETAEALAELWHKKIREELGIAGKDAKEIKRLFSQGYQGSRYSFGYPACPNLEDHTKLFELLHPEQIGVHLTEEFMLEPEQSTDAIIVHHPEAKYFNVKP